MKINSILLAKNDLPYVSVFPYFLKIFQILMNFQNYLVLQVEHAIKFNFTDDNKLFGYSQIH